MEPMAVRLNMSNFKFLSFAAFIFSIGAAIFVSTLSLPEPYYDPLGSGTMPQVLALIVCGLVVLLVISTLIASKEAREPEKEKTEIKSSKPKEYKWLAAAIVLLFGAYVLVMQLEILGFIPATMAFLVVSMSLMMRFDPAVSKGSKGWVITAVIAVVMSVGLEFLFTQVLVVNLP